MRLEKKLDQLKCLSSELFGFSMDCEVRLDLRGLSAGKADISKNIIRLNSDFLTEYPEQMVHEILVHEYAHLIAYAIDSKCGNRHYPHGKTWKYVMNKFGVTPTRTHNLDISKTFVREMKYFLYRCECGEHRLSAIRHNRAQRSENKFYYKCKHCGLKLMFVKSLDV